MRRPRRRRNIRALPDRPSLAYGRVMPADELLSDNDRKDALSQAFAAAVAAAAGYCTSPPANFDRDSIDTSFTAGGPFSPRIDAQLKASAVLGDSGSHFAFALPRKNYDDLRKPTMVPRILIVLDMPTAAEDWLFVDESNLILRRCAYWLSLAGMPDTENTASVTVHVPKSNRFDPSALAGLMEQARTGAVA